MVVCDHVGMSNHRIIHVKMVLADGKTITSGAWLSRYPYCSFSPF